MKLCNKCIAGLLTLLVVSICSPRVSFCGDSGLSAKNGNKTITRHEPKMMATPEEKIVLEKGKMKKTNWLYIGLGTVALVGLAAGGGGGSNSSPSSDSGTVTVGW